MKVQYRAYNKNYNEIITHFNFRNNGELGWQAYASLSPSDTEVLPCHVINRFKRY